MVALTEKQKAATDRNRAAGVRAQKAAKAEREARGVPLSRGSRGGDKLEFSRSEKLERGLISVHELDDEELARKRCKSADGLFRARPYPHSPKVLQAMDIELLRRGNDVIRKSFVQATIALAELLANGDPRVRVMAIDRIMERVAGKVPDKLIAADVTPHNEVGDEIAAAVAKALGYNPEPITEVGGAPDPDADIVDAELVEDERPIRKTRKRT